MMLGIKVGALAMLGKHIITELYPLSWHVFSFKHLIYRDEAWPLWILLQSFPTKKILETSWKRWWGQCKSQRTGMLCRLHDCGGHELIATLVTCTRSSQQDQSALWQAPVSGLSGLLKRKGAGEKESKKKRNSLPSPKAKRKGNATLSCYSVRTF